MAPIGFRTKKSYLGAVGVVFLCSIILTRVLAQGGVQVVVETSVERLFFFLRTCIGDHLIWNFCDFETTKHAKDVGMTEKGKNPLQAERASGLRDRAMHGHKRLRENRV